MINNFNKLELSVQMEKGLEKMGFETPTQVQKAAIGPMMTGQDLLVQAPTGTGKTCAFGIPVVEMIDPNDQKIQAIVLCPTRELAIQSAKVIKQLSEFKPGIRVQTVYGGEPIHYQISALKRRPQIVVATPGRLMDHMNRKTIRLSSVKQIVLDEADRMLDMGFRDDINDILKGMPQPHQTVLFSATLSSEIKGIASLYQQNAQKIEIQKTTQAANRIEQFYSEVQPNRKISTLESFLRDKQFRLSLVFVATKAMADKLAAGLNENGLKADTLHGGLNQRQRDNVMKKYRNGQIRILVATDIAARGIDVDNIDAVINFDIPGDAESYIHRIGRTGRADQSGTAYSFVSSQEYGKFQKMMKIAKADIGKLQLTFSNKNNNYKKKVLQVAGA